MIEGIGHLRRPCGTWVLPPWTQFFFYATSNSITIDIMNISCPGSCDGVKVMLIEYPSEECMDGKTICDMSDFRLEFDDLVS